MAFIDDMVSGYLACALWLATDDDENPLDETYSTSDFAASATDAAREACSGFVRAVGLDTLQVLSVDGSQHGHDLWLTRNGHGCGFWDRGYGPQGEYLSAIARKYGERNVEIGNDGDLHFFP